MSNMVLIMGESGTGKSSSIEKLDSKETFIIAVTGKPLPFRGAAKRYTRFGKENPEGNYKVTDDWKNILTVIEYVDTKMPHIKTLVIDDFQYVMCNEFMRKADEKGWDKFTDIGKHAWLILEALTKCRPDLDCFILSHTETTGEGKAKFKTIGKMLDEKITVEGLFTVVLHSLVTDKGYGFLTQYHKNYVAKSPRGMFENFIDNDLLLIKNKIYCYFNEDVAA